MTSTAARTATSSACTGPRAAGPRATSTSRRATDALWEGLTARTRLVWFESPSNPLLKVTDIAAAAATIRDRAAQAGQAPPLVVVDNTFASPALQRPLELGADIVFHSATKYLGGHSDAILGIAVTSSDAVAERLRFLQNAMGGVPGPFDCFLILRGLRTLALRMERHSRQREAVARFLAGRDDVAWVGYPGLDEGRHAHPGPRDRRAPDAPRQGPFPRQWLLESLSFLAVILGTVAGGLLSHVFHEKHDEYYIGLILLGLAVVGFAASLFIQPMPAAIQRSAVPAVHLWPPGGEFEDGVRSRPLRLAMVGIAFFTFMVAFMRATVYMLGESQSPRWSESKTSVIVGTTSLGIALAPARREFSPGGRSNSDSCRSARWAWRSPPRSAVCSSIT